MAKDLEYRVICAFNLGAGLALLFRHHWLGLFNGAVGAVGFVVGFYADRRNRKA